MDVTTNENGTKSILYTCIAYCIDLGITKTYRILNESTGIYNETNESEYVEYINNFNEIDSIEYVSTEVEFKINPVNDGINLDLSQEDELKQIKQAKEDIIKVFNEYFN